MNYNSALYALGAILLGVIGIVFHDFALQWQAVPGGHRACERRSRTLSARAAAHRWRRDCSRAGTSASGALLLAVFYGSLGDRLHLPRAFALVAASSACGMHRPRSRI